MSDWTQGYQPGPPDPRARGWQAQARASEEWFAFEEAAQAAPPLAAWRVPAGAPAPADPDPQAPALAPAPEDPGDAPALGSMGAPRYLGAVAVPLAPPARDPGSYRLAGSETPGASSVQARAALRAPAAWALAPVDLLGILAEFPPLAIAPGFALHGFVWGVGRLDARWIAVAAPGTLDPAQVLAALPPGDRGPAPDRLDLGTGWRRLETAPSWQRAYAAMGAPLDWMLALDSDGSPRSRVASSLLYRLVEDALAAAALPRDARLQPWRDRPVLDDGPLESDAGDPPGIRTPRALAAHARRETSWRWTAPVASWDPLWTVADGQEVVTWHGLERGIARPGMTRIVRVDDRFIGTSSAFTTTITPAGVLTPGVRHD